MSESMKDHVPRVERERRIWNTAKASAAILVLILALSLAYHMGAR